MYKISHKNIYTHEGVLMTNLESGAEVSILVTQGGAIHALLLPHQNNLVSTIAGNENQMDFIQNVSYRGSKLSPFPNRIENGTYSFENQKYQLPCNNGAHSLHGLLYNSVFEIVKELATDTFAEIKLTYSYDGTDSGYPFLYTIDITYNLSNTGLRIQTEIKNSGTTEMPIGDGWHPYIRVTNKVDDLLLQIPSHKKMILNATGIPTGEYALKQFFTAPTKIGADLFDDCFELYGSNDGFQTKLIDVVNNRTLIVWQDQHYKYLQVYIPPDRKSIAIEPMTCAPNAFNSGLGLLVLKPNDFITFTFGIRLE